MPELNGSQLAKMKKSIPDMSLPSSYYNSPNVVMCVCRLTTPSFLPRSSPNLDTR